MKEKRAGRHVQVGFPRFKSRKKGLGSFRLSGAIHVFGQTIQLPRLGVLRLKERRYLPTHGVHILSATLSEKAGRRFVSLQVEMGIPDPLPTENPRALKQALTRLKRLQRVVSRRQTGSASRRKAVRQLARAHYRVANIRKDALHQATPWLATTRSAFGLEDLNVNGMMKNPHLAQAIADVGWYEFRRQLHHKGDWYGCQVFLADRFFPSTKRCSPCGHERQIGLAERVYCCEMCGLVMERDLNAAIHLEQWLYV